MSDMAAIAAAKAHQAIMDMASAFRKAELDRIIALLESTRPGLNSVLDQEEALLLDFYIALIKGENK